MPPRAPSPETANGLRDAYTRLLKHYGEQHWWPRNFSAVDQQAAPTADEIAIGAVLVQRTSWRNVERALGSLAAAGIETLDRVAELAEEELAELIRDAGPPRVKARRLLALARFAGQHGGLRTFLSGVQNKRVALERREQLLGVHGVGPETADCLLLYAGGAPLPVIDAFLRRVLKRHGWLDADAAYGVLQQQLASVFGDRPKRHNEMHALVVRLGGDRCKASRPDCAGCPLEPLLPEGCSAAQ